MERRITLAELTTLNPTAAAKLTVKQTWATFLANGDNLRLVLDRGVYVWDGNKWKKN